MLGVQMVRWLTGDHAPARGLYDPSRMDNRAFVVGRTRYVERCGDHGYRKVGGAV